MAGSPGRLVASLAVLEAAVVDSPAALEVAAVDSLADLVVGLAAAVDSVVLESLGSSKVGDDHIFLPIPGNVR